MFRSLSKSKPNHFAYYVQLTRIPSFSNLHAVPQPIGAGWSPQEAGKSRSVLIASQNAPRVILKRV
jgi:hypothetical protein